jgi:hypothetical protein
MGVQQERRPARARLDVAGGTSGSTEQIEYTPAVQSFCKMPPLHGWGLTARPRLCYTMTSVMIGTPLTAHSVGGSSFEREGLAVEPADILTCDVAIHEL